MRAQGATEHDVETYLTQVEGIQPQEGLAKGMGRAFMQGATFNFGDELGLTDRAKEQAFQQNHPIADFLAKLTGGALAPAAAVVAAPELGAGLGGAALLGAGAGALSGAGEGTDAGSRTKGAILGGLLGAGGGAAGYGVGKAAGAVGSTILDRMNPERAVARAASKLITPATAQRMAAVDALAPGGSSIATATVPKGVNKTTDFLTMTRGLGASPDAAATASLDLATQREALRAGAQRIGAQMNAISGDVPVTPELVQTLKQVSDVLGSKANIGPGTEPGTVAMSDMRDALTRLRYQARQAAKRGTEANGATTYEINQARDALADQIYQHSPEFAALDQHYAALQNELRQADKLTKTVDLSRRNYAGNEAYRATAGSLGGSLPRGSHGVIMTALDKMLTNKAGAADAVARLITKPGGPDMVDRLLGAVPKPNPILPQARGAGLASLIPAMRGLLFPADSTAP